MTRSQQLLAFALPLGLASASLAVPPGKFAALVAGLVFFLAVMARPAFGLYSFAFLAVFLPYSTVTLGIRITISEAFLVLTWFAVTWRNLSPGLDWTLSTTQKAVLALLVFSVIPFIYGELFVTSANNGVVFWIRWLLNVSTLLLTTLLITNKRQLFTLLGCLILGATLMVLVSMSYFLHGFDARNITPFLKLVRYGNPDAYIDILSSFNKRMGSPWVHPNLLGGLLAMVLPLVFGWWLSSRQSRVRYLLLLAAVVILGGIFLSVSRGAILSVAGVLCWLAIRRTPYAKSMLLGGIALGAAAALFYPPVQQRLLGSTASVSRSDNLRIAEYKKFPEAVMHYPLGIGFTSDPPPPGTDLLGISNLWLNYAYKLGFAGMFLFVWVTRKWWLEVRPEPPAGAPGYYLHQGVVAGIIGALLTGLFDHYYGFTNVLCGLFWMLLGVSLLTARMFNRTGISESMRGVP